MINLEFTWNGRTVDLKNKSERLKRRKLAKIPVDSENLKFYNSHVFLLQSAAGMRMRAFFCNHDYPDMAAMTENLWNERGIGMIMEENYAQNTQGLSKGQQCRLIREQTGLTQSEFGFVVGASKNAVSGWETEKYEPSESHWKVIQALPDLQKTSGEGLQLAFLKILPLCPACRKIVEEYIHGFFSILRKKLTRKDS